MEGAMLSPVADMYYVKSTALMTIILMMVGAQLVTCILILSQHANQILYTLWKEEKKETQSLIAWCYKTLKFTLFTHSFLSTFFYFTFTFQCIFVSICFMFYNDFNDMRYDLIQMYLQIIKQTYDCTIIFLIKHQSCGSCPV